VSPSAEGNRTLLRRFIVRAAMIGVVATALAGFSVPESNYIEGRVTDPQGRGLADVCVAVHSVEPTGSGVPRRYLDARTGSDGTYRITHLVSLNDYVVEFRPCDSANGIPEIYNDRPYSHLWQREVFDVVMAPASGVDAVLLPGGSISGNVVDTDGRPIPACVSLLSSRYAPGLATGSDGRFSFGGLPPSNYGIVFHAGSCGYRGGRGPYHERHHPERAILSDGTFEVGPATSAEFELVALRYGAISGRITGERGRPANAVCVFAKRLNHRKDLIHPFSWSRVAVTDEAGQYRIGDVTQGRWRVVVGRAPVAGIDPTLAYDYCTALRTSPRVDMAHMGARRVLPEHTTRGVDGSFPRAIRTDNVGS
jgi:hypothetical protein